MRQWRPYAIGALVGAVSARFFLTHPEGRKLAKTLVKRTLLAGRWIASELHTLREDVSDLVAEAQEELDQDPREGATGTTGAADHAEAADGTE